MNAGISSFAFGWAVAHGSPPLDEHALLRFARDHAIHVVQLGDNMPVHTWTSERLDQFVDAARRGDISVELGARGLTDEHLGRYLELSGRCGSGLLRFVPDSDAYQPSAEDLIAVIRNALPALAERGITLAIENHDRFPAAVLRRIIESLGSSRVGICLDCANSLGAGEGLREVLDVLAPLTMNLHVKDVRISRLPHMMGFIVEGRPLGEGQLPIGEVIACVRRYGRCAHAILEAWTPPAETMQETIARERRSAESSINRLKMLVSRPD